MKTIKNGVLSVLLFCCAGGAAWGQSWFPIGAKWIYHYSNGGVHGFVEHEVAGDTTVDGQACRAIDVVLNYVYGTNVSPVQLDPIVVRESGGLVLVHVPEIGFDTLYNMNAAVGERWMLSRAPEPCDTNSYMEVVDEGQWIVDGVPLKWLVVDTYAPSVYDYALRDTILERVGTLFNYLLPQSWCMGATDGNLSDALRCYQDAQVEYRAAWASICEFPVGTNEYAKLQQRLLLYPNPGVNEFWVETAFPSPVELFITDIAGRTVHVSTMQGSMGPLDVSGLSPGIYTVLAMARDGSRSTAKWTKNNRADFFVALSLALQCITAINCCTRVPC